MLKYVIFSFVLLFVAEARDPEEELDLFEGDIELPPVTGFRSFINVKEKLWPGGVVPYQFDDQHPISDEQKANLSIAMKDIMDHTCIKFQYTTDPDVKHLVIIQKSKMGCTSQVGMLDSSYMRGQNIRYSDECFERIGSLTHELMHSLGFFHEQSRYDRDEYVKIVPQNVDQGKIRQFRLHTLSEQNVELGAPYDFGSLMHYSSYAFSSSDSDTIVPLYEAEIGQREKMSEIDIWKVNKLYNCPNVGPTPKVYYGRKKHIDESSLYKLSKYFNCDFEFFWACGMRDEMDSEFDWKIGKGQVTTFFESGPKAGADGEACCYLYLDTMGRNSGASSTVVTPPLQPTVNGGSCFSFQYHMYGKGIGSLYVYWRTMGSTEEHRLLEEVGSKGDQWNSVQFLLNIDEPFEVVFKGTVGEMDSAGYEAYIAVDNLKLTPMSRMKRQGLTCE